MTAINLKKSQIMFASMNGRAENHGDEHQPAVDLPAKFHADTAFVKALIPNDAKVTEFFWSKGGNSKLPFLCPLTVNRKIEDLEVTIHDGQKKPMVFKQAVMKNPSLTFTDHFGVEVSAKLQLHPSDAQWARLAKLMKEQGELTIVSTQSDVEDGDGN